MAGSVKDLASYRYGCAVEDLTTARAVMPIGQYKSALNRSYYSIFHSLRAVNALDGFDSRKHSGVIAHFNQYHVKSGDFPKEVSQMIRRASEMRENADYEDFFIASMQEAEAQIQDAAFILDLVGQYLSDKGVYIEIGGCRQ